MNRLEAKIEKGFRRQLLTGKHHMGFEVYIYAHINIFTNQILYSASFKNLQLRGPEQEIIPQTSYFLGVLGTLQQQGYVF